MMGTARALGIFVLVLLLFWVEPRLGAERVSLHLEEKGRVAVSELFLRLLGELRYTLASYIWLDTEIYHHEVGLTEESSAVGRDDPAKVGEILAICRLVTRLDPKFVQAYDIASWRLGKGLGNFPKAISFLQEGIAENPQSALLREDLGEIYFFYLRDYAKAIPPLREAALLNRDRLEKANAYRMLAFCYEREKRWGEALAIYDRLLMIFPDDTTVMRRIQTVRGFLKKP